MPDPKQLPYLLNLLDDDSEIVREEVRKELNSWGESLKTELARMLEPPSPRQRKLLQEMMSPHSRSWLEAHWQEWMDEPNEVLALEKALSQLSEFLTGFMHPSDLSILLDDMATLYKQRYPDANARDLSQFLFKDLGLKGAQADFGNAFNSSLTYVIREKKGIPLSLSCVYILVGARLGLHVEGCNFPGHFLARVTENGEPQLVDCFNGGALVDFKVLAQMSEQTPWGVQNVLHYPAPTRAIVARALGNLIKCFGDEKREEDVQLMLKLSDAMERDLAAKEAQGLHDPADLLKGHPRFRTGDIVNAPKLGWRGVIVDFDLSCRAPESWYLAHGGGSRKAQAWYHIFIDNSQQVGYAAEESLLLDQSGEKVYHPLVPHFFDKFENGRFWRNNRAWPGTL